MKRAHLKLVVTAMLLVLSYVVASCSNSENGTLTSTAVSNVEIVTPTTTPTQTPTSTPTIIPTPTPIPTLTHSAEDELAMAPDISGLSKEVQDGKVVYLAAKDNEYELEKGKFAGEYNPNVSVEGKEVGAVAFIPVVAEKILNDQLAEFPEGEQEFKILLPVDTTQAGENNINITSLYKDTDQEMLQISCDSDLDVLNIIPDTDMFFISWWSDPTIGKYGSILYVGENSEKGTERNALYNVQILIPETDSIDSTTTTLNIKFASIIGTTDGKNVWVANGGTEGPYPVKMSDMVTINGKLVSITSKK